MNWYGDRGKARGHKAHATVAPVILPSTKFCLYYRLFGKFCCQQDEGRKLPATAWQQGPIDNSESAAIALERDIATA
jgi:hypothetical protein